MDISGMAGGPRAARSILALAAMAQTERAVGGEGEGAKERAVGPGQAVEWTGAAIRTRCRVRVKGEEEER